MEAHRGANGMLGARLSSCRAEERVGEAPVISKVADDDAVDVVLPSSRYLAQSTWTTPALRLDNVRRLEVASEHVDGDGQGDDRARAGRTERKRETSEGSGV